MIIKAQILDTASIPKVNTFIEGKNIRKIEPLTTGDGCGGQRITGYIIYWRE